MNESIEVYLKKGCVAKHTLNGSRLIVGRGPECGIRVNEELVSREHAAIFPKDGAHWVEDLESRNGTWVAGQKIAGRRRLQDGDSIRVGSHELRFRSDSPEARDDDATRAVEAPADVPASRRIAQKSGPVKLWPRLKVSEGYLKGEVFENWEGTLVIGRGQDCHVPMISDEFLSLQHAEIRQDGDQFLLVDLGSDNGTFLNKRRLPPGQREVLKHGDKIRAGKSGRFVFELLDKERERRFRKRALIGFGAVIAIAMAAAILRPEDPVEQCLERAGAAYQRGQLVEAASDCDAALRLEPRRPKALELKRLIETQLRADRLVDQAQTNALAGRFDEAKGLCNEALRIAPKHVGGSQLTAVLNSISLANRAIEAQNWPGAIQALEGEQARFKESDVIRSRLDLAKRELDAYQQLSRAREYARNNQPDMAETCIQAIPAQSIYHPEGAGLRSAIQSQRLRNTALNQATAAYRVHGEIAQALRLTEDALAASPGDAPLAALRTRLQTMTSLAGPLDEAGRLGESASLDALLAGVKACDAIEAAESDPLNWFHRKAKSEKSRIQILLTGIANRLAAEAERMEKAGQRREACRLALDAVRAAPADASLRQRCDHLRETINAEASENFRAGYQWLGKDDALARRYFVTVTNLSLPNLSTNPKEQYYEKAVKQLQELARR